MSTEARQEVLLIGVSKMDITPLKPVALAGFSHRKGVYDNVTRRLYARLFLLEQAEQRTLLVTADLIWWGPEVVDALRQAIWNEWGIPSERVLLHATHNHSGPQTTARFVPALGSTDESYVQFLQSRINDGFRECLKSLEPVEMEVGTGIWSEGVNRRNIVNGVCIMAPNDDGANDQRVTVIRFQTVDGQTKSILVHATCHPTTTGDNKVSSEFPGYAMELLEREFASRSAIAGFLQGFCANVRPALVRDGEFYRGDDGDVQRIGSALADEVMQILKHGMHKVEPSEIAVVRATVELPFSQLPDGATLESAAQSDDKKFIEWATVLLGGATRIKETVPLDLTLVRLTDTFRLLAANAEMVVEYGKFAQSCFDGILLPLGYTNGMVGYVPTAQQLAEGGYESVESTYYFGLPAPFSQAIEANIQKAILQLGGRE